MLLSSLTLVILYIISNLCDTGCLCKGCSHDFVEMTVLHKFHAAYRAGLYCDGLVSDDLFDRRAQDRGKTKAR